MVDSSEWERLQEIYFDLDMRKRFYIELSKAGFEEEQIRAIRDIVRQTCLKCLDGGVRCKCDLRDMY